MEHEFWHQRWQLNQIGFHNEEVNQNLLEYWPKLNLQPGGRVFVPMCGKSKDILWLLNQGYQVVAVELSPLAVEAFFTENNLQAICCQQGHFLNYQIDGLQILCGDFFALQKDELGKIDAVYDRGALVALPEQMRTDYVAKMQSLLEQNARILLIALDYLQDEISGPPFNISYIEIEKLYAGWCDVVLLSDQDVLDNEPHLKSRGLSQLRERVYCLNIK